nr:helix-turn-helix domain-containing protein [Gordonia insulae]
MIDQNDKLLRTAAARADFLEYGPAGAVGVTDVVAASWERSKSAGVDADLYSVPFHEDIDFDSRLVRCARPVIERLTDDMADVPLTIALTDAHARIVDRRDCSTAVGRVLDRVDFQRGFSFEESSVGTNGVGTVFEVGAAVSVVGSEHFNQKLVQFACTGAPILDPMTGRVAGVLDVSMLADSWSSLIHALVRSAAADISRNLFLDRSQAKRALFENYLRADSRPRQAVMASGDTVIVNEHARQLLSPDEQSMIAQHAEFLLTMDDRVAHIVTLDSGRRIRLRGKQIICRDEVVGIVALLDEQVNNAGTPSARPAPQAFEPSVPHRRYGVGPMRSTGWLAARGDTLAALAGGTGLLMIGEPGTGKVTMVTECFAELHGDTPVFVLDGASLNTTDIAFIGKSTDGLLIIRHAEMMTSDDEEVALEAIELAKSSGHAVAATLRGAHAGEHTVGRVIALLGQSVTVPPMRLRTVDVPALVARTLHDLAPQRQVRLSPRALRVVTAFSWPRNITQLREALHWSLQRRPVGEIQAEDLPGFCRTSGTRTLTPLETTERDAIVRALEEACGNRMHAAAALGMSRSSLYRKLRAYSITGL